MRKYRLLHCGIFFYDTLRLFVIVLTIAAALHGGNGGFDVLPVLLYAAPNALFPLMAFFLWTRPAQFQGLLPLYPAGKIISVAASAAWFVFSGRSIVSASLSLAMMRNYAVLAAPVSAVLLLLLDGISGAVVLASVPGKEGGTE